MRRSRPTRGSRRSPRTGLRDAYRPPARGTDQRLARGGSPGSAVRSRPACDVRTHAGDQAAGRLAHAPRETTENHEQVRPHRPRRRRRGRCPRRRRPVPGCPSARRNRWRFIALALVRAGPYASAISRAVGFAAGLPEGPVVVSTDEDRCRSRSPSDPGWTVSATSARVKDDEAWTICLRPRGFLWAYPAGTSFYVHRGSLPGDIDQAGHSRHDDRRVRGRSRGAGITGCHGAGRCDGRRQRGPVDHPPRAG